MHQDRVAIDPDTGQVTARADWADRPLLSKLTSLGISAHMGRLFGGVSQLALAALALGLICMIVWGYRMWWQRRPTRSLGLGAPAAGRRPSGGSLVAVGAIAVLAGLALPLLGVSLLTFLVLDALVIGYGRPWWRARTATATSGPDEKELVDASTSTDEF